MINVPNHPFPKLLPFRNNNPFKCKTLDVDEQFVAVWLWNNKIWSATVKFNDKRELLISNDGNTWRYVKTGMGHINMTFYRQRKIKG